MGVAAQKPPNLRPLLIFYAFLCSDWKDKENSGRNGRKVEETRHFPLLYSYSNTFFTIPRKPTHSDIIERMFEKYRAIFFYYLII